MIGLNIVWYLFLAGVGSGTFVVTLIETRHLDDDTQDYGDPLRLRAITGYFTAAGCMVIASVFLVFDLGDPLYAWRAVLVPFSSITAFGATCVMAFTTLTVAVALAALMLARLPRWLLWFVRSVGVAFAAATMVYAGMLLYIMGAVAVWHTWLVPALFVISSLACGIAAFLFLEAFLPDERMSSLATWQVHLGFSLLEAAVIVAFVFDRMGVGASASESIQSLLVGDCALAFWFGVVGVGLVAPVLIHILYWRIPQEALVIAASLSVLAGALFLRFCVVEIALHAPLFPV